MKIFIANIGWMMHYKGQSGKDKISGGGSYTNTDKHEVYNFQDNGGYCYGYVESNKGRLNLSRIDSGHIDENKISDVLAVWVAKDPKNGGTYIVGWYKHATVYASYQNLPTSNAKVRSGYAYNIKAKATNCVLLPVDARTFQFRRGKGYLGQTNYCYLDKDLEEVKSYREEVIDYVTNYAKTTHHKKPRLPKPNPELNKRIEKAAVDTVIESYKSLGYELIDRQKDATHPGWDFDAIKGKIRLQLEVKGNASSEALVRISCNEFKAMKINPDTYRLCVVTNALKKPDLYVFAHDESGEWVWENDSRLHLNINEQIAVIAQFIIEE